MAKVKVSEWSATPGSNTDIDGINIAENCPPSGINDAIREMMSQLKDFQTGAAGDSFNGPVGSTTPAAGAFTTLLASGAVTLSGGTANGIPYLNGSKVLTTGSALTYSNSEFTIGDNGTNGRITLATGASVTQLLSTTTGFGAYQAFEAKASEHRWFIGGSSEQMRLTSTGLGIGTSSPGAKLHVSSSVASGSVAARVANTDATGMSTIEFSDGTNTKGQIWAGNGSYASFGGAGSLNYSANSGPHVWYNNYTEKMRLDSSGNLLVGTTSNANFAKVFLLATASGPAFACQGYSGDVSAPAAIFGKFDNNSTTSQVLVRFTINNNSAGSGQINANGANSAAFGSFSDARLKENIADLPSQLANVLSLRPVEFDYIASEGGGHQVGFIAQEMQEVYPDAVGERSDGMLTVTGWSKTEARLVKAIQEQQAIIESLKARLDAANL